MTSTVSVPLSAVLPLSHQTSHASRKNYSHHDAINPKRIEQVEKRVFF
jgi:hypothetical protein